MSNLKNRSIKVRYTIILLCVLAFVGAWAQEKKTEKTKEKEKPKPIPVYLGKTNIRDTSVSEKLFDKLLPQGLTCFDSLGKEYKMARFLLTYGERNLYEDSVGKLMVLTDLVTFPCDSGRIDPYLVKDIVERSKAGDTVYFDEIIVRAPEGYHALGKSMRIVITK